MGEPETPHVYDVGIFERVPGSRNQLFLSLETPGYLKNQEKLWDISNKYYLCNYQEFVNQKG